MGPVMARGFRPGTPQFTEAIGRNRESGRRIGSASPSYGDFAAGSGLDVVERINSARDFSTQHVREFGRERSPKRLCDAILRFRVLTDDDFDLTTQGEMLLVENQHGG
jgi:hypothetical protein